MTITTREAYLRFRAKRVYGHTADWWWEHYPEHCLARAFADIEAEEAEGVRFMPAEATEEILNSARDWSVKKYGIGIGNDAAIGCLSVMLSASPFAAKE